MRPFPAYFDSICHSVSSVEGHVMLRSANYRQVTEPYMKVKRYGVQCLRVAAATVWNNLPKHLVLIIMIYYARP